MKLAAKPPYGLTSEQYNDLLRSTAIAVQAMPTPAELTYLNRATSVQPYLDACYNWFANPRLWRDPQTLDMEQRRILTKSIRFFMLLPRSITIPPSCQTADQELIKAIIVKLANDFNLLG
jgi:hypothetical protein